MNAHRAVFAIQERQPAGVACAVPQRVASSGSGEVLFRSESNYVEIMLLSRSASLRVDYVGVPRDASCPAGYSALARRRKCVGMSDEGGKCPAGGKTAEVETADEMEEIEDVLRKG